MAACTSCAAASMSRSSENWMTICVSPRLDVDVMLSTPAMVENCFSSGVATVAAIVDGLAPGSTADTVIVGKSTFGRSLTGSCLYATMPKNRMATMTSVVMIGRLMKRVVRFMSVLASVAGGERRTIHGWLVAGRPGQLLGDAAEPRLQIVEIGIEDRRDVEGHDL